MQVSSIFFNTKAVNWIRNIRLFFLQCENLKIAMDFWLLLHFHWEFGAKKVFWAWKRVQNNDA